MAAMFKKGRNRNFRKKNFNEEDENGAEEQGKEEENKNEFMVFPKSEENGGVEKKDKKNKGKIEHVPSSNSLLSFDDDVEGGDVEVFKVKKSKESRRLAKMLEKEKKRKDKKKDKEPEPEVVKMSISENDRGNSKESVHDDHDEKLAALRAELSKMSKDDDEDDDFDIDEDNVIDKVQSTESLSSSKHVFNIPDAQTIHAARKKREMARAFGTQDFIPIDDTQRLSGRFGTTSSSSRLVREDENDASDDEDGPISFSAAKKTHPALERRRQVEDALINQENEEVGEDAVKEDEEDELKRWEEEQIRKGVSVPQMQQEQDNMQNDEMLMQQDQYYYNQGTLFSQDYSYQTVPQSDSNQSLRPLMSTEDRRNVTMDSAWEKINKRLVSIQEVNRGHRMEMDKFLSHRQTAEDSIEELEKQGIDVEKRFKFFQEMRGYVKDLLECLNEKVPIIDKIEHSMHALWKQKAARLVQRRQEDVKDQDEEYTATQSGKQSHSNTLDEFGRDRSMFQDLARQRRIAEREGRKKRRRQQREQDRNKGNGKADSHHEGLSTDDEQTEGEILKYKTETDNLLKEASTVMEDVVDEFSEITAIKSRFEQWKYFHTASYKEAYISLCLPKLFTPFIRLQLLDWNPFQANCQDFEEMQWYKDLLLFGFPNEESIDIEDSDVKLLPSLVEKALLPKLTGLFEYVWDPLSTKQSLLAVALVKQLATDYPTVTAQNKATQLLFNAIVNRLRRCVIEDVYVPLYPKALLDNKSSGCLSFFQRQFWSCVKLFSNIVLWQGLISSSRLQELAMDGLLSRYMILALQHSHLHYDSLEKCKVIIKSIPPQWMDTSSGMEAFSRYLVNLASCIQRSSAGCSDSEKKKSRSGVKKVIQLLLQIKDSKKAKSVAHEHDMEELVKDVHSL